MKLTLSISMCPSGSNMEGQQYQFSSEGGTFGRSADNAWVLPDISRHVSSLHGRISVENGQFILSDHSTNGLFVNGSAQALGPNKSIVLSHGDQLTFGDYCIQVSLAPDLPQAKDSLNDPDATHISSQATSSQAASIAYIDDLDKWLEPASSSSDPVPSTQGSFNSPPTPPAASLGDIDLGLKPQETDPLAALGGVNVQPKPLSSSGGALSDLLGESVSLDQQMMKIPNVIPNDWDDLLGVDSNVQTEAQSPVSAPAAEPSVQLSSQSDLGQTGAATLSQSEQEAGSEITNPGHASEELSPSVDNLSAVPQDLGLSELLSMPAEQIQKVQGSLVENSALENEVEPPVAPQITAQENTYKESAKLQTSSQIGDTQSSINHASTALKNSNDAPPAISAQTGAVNVDAESLARELGLERLNDAQLAVLQSTVVNTVKETVSGMMRTLRARSEIKSEFRLNMTTIQSAENNPLKFSVTPEDAIENMFAKQGKAYLSPIDAINDGFADISDHQVALFDAMKAAYEHIFSQFDPEFLAKKFERTAGKRFLGGKVKNWEAFQLLYNEYKDDNEQTFKRLFGEVFADAYERRMHSLKMSHGHASNK